MAHMALQPEKLTVSEFYFQILKLYYLLSLRPKSTLYMIKKYGMNIEKNYNDCGVMLYDILKQPVYAGGSGPACSALVNFGYIFKKMKNRELKKVLIVPTGALFSPTLLYQKETIPAIAHAVGIEVVE